jgi:hypothetical protein
MRTLRHFIIFAMISLAGLGNAFAQALDISSGGTPTITGAVNGSVTGSSSLTSDLVVTVNFGEVSPLNTNNIVKVTVPIGIRSNQPYMVSVTYTGSININAQAIQKSDIGFGVNNMRAMGSNSRVYANPHTFYSPFNNDPSTGVTTDVNGRAKYTSSLNNVSALTTILSGPRLSNGNNNRQGNDGYIFDAIFVITPQFYATGTTTATLTFSIAAGPNVSC